MGMVIAGGVTIAEDQEVEITALTCTMPAGTSPLVLGASARNAGCNGIVDLADAGAGAGKLRGRDGTTVLFVVTLSDPAFGNASTGVATAGGLPLTSAPAVAAGDCDNYQLLDSDDNVIFTDNDVS